MDNSWLLNAARGAWGYFARFLRAVMSFLFRLIGKEMSEEFFGRFLQFVKFCFIGLSNTLVNYVVYAVVLWVFKLAGANFRYDYMVGNLFGFLISVIWSWYWNSHLVFKAGEKQRPWWQVLLKTYAAYAFTGIFLSNVISWAWVELLHLPKLLAPVIYTVTNVPINFLLNKFWAYGDKS